MTPAPMPVAMAQGARSVRIDRLCTACGSCVVTCPEHALIRAPKMPAVRDDRCTGCGACIEVCPVDAITDVLLVEGVLVGEGTTA